MNETEIQSIIRKNSRPLTVVPTDVEPNLRLIPSLKIIIFDIYGTLFISGSGDIGVNQAMTNEDRFREAAEASDIRLNKNIDEYLTNLNGEIKRSHQRSKENGVEFPEVDIVEIWKSVLGGDFSEIQISRFAVEYESRVNSVWPMPDLMIVLEKLSGDFDLGIISNAQFFTPELFSALLEKSREELGFRKKYEYFSYSHGAAKPGLYLFELLLKQLSSEGIEPSETLYVGNDMLNDIMPAQKLGFQTALFAGDKRSLRWRSDDRRVDGIEPEIIVTELTQLLACVGSEED